MALLSACAAGSYSSESGVVVAASVAPGMAGTIAAPGFTAPSPVRGTHDVLLATTSTAAVTVVVGGRQTLSITFASSDGRPLSGFALSAAASGLPDGWSAPDNFTCATVTSGSGCVLDLDYAPMAVATGTLTVAYVVVDNAGLARTDGSISIPYAATPSNNVVAAASPSGEVDVAGSGGAATVIVNFTTDDGKAATNLSMTTDLTALPTGWSSTSATFACAIVSTGNGCQLPLTYAGGAAVSGTLSLAFGYIDDAGLAKSGTLNIPFRSRAANVIVATASPSGQITAVQKTGGQSVSITFTTDDGKPASQLHVTSNLASLPPGWTSTSPSFSCTSVSTGNGCQLHLKYAPTALASGTLTLGYAYVDGSGTGQTGSMEVAYTATTNDNVIGTAAPAGQINAIVGSGAQAVMVSFGTDDGRPATALQVTTDLTHLPPGWSAAVSTFSCSGLDAVVACTLPLVYAPAAAGRGALSLAYAYRDDAGEAKSGTVAIAYRATTDDTVVGSALPAMLTVRSGSTTPVTVTFATDDGNPASQLSVGTDLTHLPPGWSAVASSLACATLSTGSACTLPLTYAPSVAASGIVSLAYSYTNDAGIVKQGTVSIPYTATTPYLYVANGNSTDLSACPLNVDDSLGACTTTAFGLNAPADIAFDGSFAYIPSTSGNSVMQCTADAGGALTGCAVNAGFSAPTAVVVNPTGTMAYVSQATGLLACAITPGTGSLSGCTVQGAGYAPLAGFALSADGLHAYAVHSTTVIDVCSVDPGGLLTACTSAGGGATQAAAVLAVHDGYLYVSTLTGALYACPFNADATVGQCRSTAAGSQATALAFSDAAVYASSHSNAVAACTVNGDGTFGACTADGDPTFNGTTGIVVR